MLRGIEIRYLYNSSTNDLLKISNESRLSNNLTEKQKENIQIYLESSHNLIDKFEKKNKLDEKNILNFLDKFVIITKELLNNCTKGDINSLIKDVSELFLEKIKENYSLKIQSQIDVRLNDIKNYVGEKQANLVKEKKKVKQVNKNSNSKKNQIGFKEFIITGVILVLILLGIYYYYSLPEEIVIDKNVTNITSSENQTIEDENETKENITQPPIVVVEEFKLTKLESDVIDRINLKRRQYYKEEYIVNMELSEVLREYLTIGLEQDFDIAREEVGDLATRAKKGNVTSQVIENVYDIENTNSIGEIVETMENSNLYLESYQDIALAIVEKDGRYHIILNVYKR